MASKPLPKKVVDTILATANGHAKAALAKYGSDPVKLAERAKSIKDGLAMDLGCAVENIVYVKGKGYTYNPDPAAAATIGVERVHIHPHVKMPDEKGIAKGEKPSCKSFAVTDDAGKVLTWLPVKGMRQIIENLRSVVAKADSMTDDDLAVLSLATLREETDSDKFAALHTMIVANFPDHASKADAIPAPVEIDETAAALFNA